MKDEAPYLGHIISKDGIKMDPKKVETIQNWPDITSIKQLQAFLGLMGYYRKFIKNFTHIAKPMTDLLKNESVNEWGDAHTAAKQELISIITNAPLLQSPNYSKPFTIATDASNIALGAILSQGGKPVAFLSKTFSDRECNWDIYEKELFTIIYTIRKWEHYLQSSLPFTIITDNNVVSHFQNQKKLNAKQMRWITYLAAFTFNIVHHPGTENKVTDAISQKDIFGITINNQHWIDHIRQLSKKVIPKPWMTQRNGLFFKGNRLYIPGYLDIKMLIIEEIHQGMGGGHLRFKKTLEKVSRNYFWEQMPNSIQQFISSCDICQRTKSSTQKPFGMLNLIPPPSNKFDVYSMDFIGPLPTMPKGHNGILVIIDMFTKAATLEPINFTFGAAKVAEIFFKRIISQQGLPIKIISDRDP